MTDKGSNMGCMLYVGLSSVLIMLTGNAYEVSRLESALTQTRTELNAARQELRDGNSRIEAEMRRLREAYEKARPAEAYR